MTDEKRPHPGEPHHYTIECDRCGVPGMLNLAILAYDERFRIETVEPPTPIEDLLVDVPPVEP